MKKIREIIQEESSDCGVCSLECIIEYYGGYIPLEELRINTNTDYRGTNAYELIKCAKKYGFNSFGKKVEKLSDIDYPVIVHLKMKNNLFHFVVVYRINKKYIYMMDPSIGLRKISINEFYELFTGVVLYFEPINTIPKFNCNKFLYKTIKLEYITNKNKYILLVILSCFILLFYLLISFEIKLLSININFIFLFLLVIIINELIIYYKNKYILNLTMNFNNKTIKSFILHIFKLPLKYLKLKKKGEISTRFNELNELCNTLINISIEIIFSIFLTILILLIVFLYNKTITSILLFVTLIYFLINIKIYSKLVNDIRYSINLEEDYNSKIIEYISGIETIKNINKYSYFKKNMFLNLECKNNIRYDINKKIYKVNFINNLIINILLLLVLFIIFKSDYNSINSLTIFILINYFINNIKIIINYFPSLLLLRSFIKKNSEFLSIKYNKYPFEKTNFDNINIKDITYKLNYNNILNNINFNIKSKDKIFVNGPSGIGKSTLMRIINQEIDEYSGLITKDNVDIKECNLSNLVSYVSQNEVLFDDTIYNNITLEENINNDTFNNIIRICKLDNIFNNKVSKLDSIVINNSNISGGERNRIILARSLLHSKDILILDEVLKEVDIKLEIEILKDLLEYYKNKTIIYISHKNVGFLFDKILTLGKE